MSLTSDAAIVALWVVVVLLAVLVLLLYRQFGLIMMPADARLGMDGLDIGKRIPPLTLEVFGSEHAVTGPTTWRGEDWDSALVVFANPDCPLCEALWEDAKTTETTPPRGSGPELVWIDGGGNSREGSLPPQWRVFVSPDENAHNQADVPAVPFFYRLEQGVVVDKGIVKGSLEPLVRSARPSKAVTGGRE